MKQSRVAAELNKKLRDPAQFDQTIEVLIGLAESGVQADRAHANICIIYDHMRDPQALRQYLKTPENLESEDFDVWFAFGFLHQKLSHFGDAIKCFEAAVEAKPDDVHAWLGLGYCYEGVRDFDLAIDAAQQALDIAQRVVEDEPERKELLAESHHALGHFYTGRCRSRGLSIQDWDSGDYHMRHAVKLSPIYRSCLGTIHAETKRYGEALEILNEALETPEVQEDVSLLYDCLFARGYAFLGVEEYDKALEDFKRVEDFVWRTEDSDALAHVKLFMIRTELKQRSIYELTHNDIQKYLDVLAAHQPSDYVIISFRREHEKMTCFLRGLYLLKRLLSGDYRVEERDQVLDEILHHLEDITPENIRLLVLTTYHSLLQDFSLPNYVSPYILTAHEFEKGIDEQVFERFDVWLVLLPAPAAFPSLLDQIFYYVGRYGKDPTIYCYDAQGVLPQHFRETSVMIWVDSLNNALRHAQFALLYDNGKRYLAEPEIPFGLVPITAAPAPLVAQTGVLPTLPMEG